MIKFVIKSLNGKNQLVSAVMKFALYRHNSYYGLYIREMMHKYCIDNQVALQQFNLASIIQSIYRYYDNQSNEQVKSIGNEFLN